MDDPIDPAEANDATLASEAKEWLLHTESTEFSEQIERIEFSDRMDHTRGSVARAVPPRLVGRACRDHAACRHRPREVAKQAGEQGMASLRRLHRSPETGQLVAMESPPLPGEILHVDRHSTVRGGTTTSVA
jgi:hypothetical protein